MVTRKGNDPEKTEKLLYPFTLYGYHIKKQRRGMIKGRKAKKKSHFQIRCIPSGRTEIYKKIGCEKKKMNATKKLAALVMACILVAAVSVPMAIGDTVSSGATVSGEAPVVVITSITPDPADPSDTVTVSGTLSDPNAKNEAQLRKEINTFQYTVEKPDASEYTTGPITVASAWSFDFDLGSGADAGVWSVEVTATDDDGLSNSYTNTFVVNEMNGYAIDFTTVDFGTVAIGTQEIVSGDDIFSTGDGKPTIRNTGNYEVMDVTISAIDMTADTDPSNTIPCANLGAAVGTAAEQDLGAERTFDVDIGLGETAAIDFTLTAPTGTVADTYTGTITVEGVF